MLGDRERTRGNFSGGHFFVMGALVRSPELRYLEKTPPLPHLRLQLGGKNEEGAWTLPVSVFGKRAELIADTIHEKGTLVVFAEGDLSWREKENREYTSLVANRVELIVPDRGFRVIEDRYQRKLLDGGINEARIFGKVSSVRVKEDIEGVFFSLAFPQRQGVGFFEVAVWGDLAKESSEIIQKGVRLGVVGRLKNRRINRGEDVAYKIQLVAHTIFPVFEYETQRKPNSSEINSSANLADPDLFIMSLPPEEDLPF